jgi:hypothetical protein
MHLPSTPGGDDADVSEPTNSGLATDATLAVVRKSGTQVVGFILVDATWLSVGGILVAASEDAPLSMVFDGITAHMDRYDANFRLHTGMFSGVEFRDDPIPTNTEGGYLVRAISTGVGATATPGLHLRAYPNPFNPEVSISFVNPVRGMVQATVHDVSGRRVAVLVARVLDAGSRTLNWDGRDEAGNPSASGVYFVRLHAGSNHAAAKLVLLR